MADFRSVTQVDRDRLVGALGNKITVQESPWLNALLITFNANKKPFDDPRVRRALSLAVDRWKAAEVLPRSTIMRYVGGYVRPGYELAAREEDLVKMPGFSRDIEASRAEARRLLEEAGRTATSRSSSPTAPSPTCSPAAASTSSTSGARSASRPSTSRPTTCSTTTR